MNYYISFTIPQVCEIVIVATAILVWTAAIYYKIGRRVADEWLQHHIDSAKLAGHSQGENEGYEKGLTDGKSLARQELRDQFILFLEEQVRLLKNGLPAPVPITQPQPEVVDQIFYMDEGSEQGVLVS